MIGIPETECNVMIQEHFGPSFPMEEYLTKCGAQLDVLYEAGISVKLGVFRLIDQLTQFGILKAIATSSSRRTATHHLKKSDLFDRFSVVITRDDVQHCLLYTSDAADDLLCVDLGGRRIIKK